MNRCTARLTGFAVALACAQTPARAQHGVDSSHLDTACAPCTDFYGYANGAWMKHATIPSAYPMWGSFYMILVRTDSLLRQIVERVTRASEPAGSTAWKLGTFYETCLDSTRAESDGVSPVRSMLSRIAAAQTARDIARAIAELHAAGVGGLFGFWAGEDPKNSNQIIANTGQGGLGLPDRDYYARTDSASERLRRKYVAYVAKLFELAGTARSQAQGDAESVMTLEKRLAEVSMTSVQLRDPTASYHKMPLAELQALTPRFDWTQYLRLMNVPTVANINVRQPDYFRGVNALLGDVPVSTWRAYLRARLLRAAAPRLNAAFVDADFAYQSNFTGANEMLPRWQRCLQLVSYGALGEALGREYVKEAFPPAAKARAQAMVADLKGALRERIQQLSWMSDSTKREAIAKLAALHVKIAYPDTWKDYSALEVAPGHFFENVLRASRWQSARAFARIGQPPDRSEWAYTPQTIDAFAGTNEIVFPAGILQPPFFDPAADDASNYGAMGSVIGHELTHHFDDRGRQYDALGNLRDWWTAADAAAYEKRALVVVEQFDAYTVLDSVTHVNGRLTLGENISDLGGLKISYTALQKRLAASGRRAAMDGFTPEQRFFLAYAQSWQQLARPEYARARIATDPHAPWMWRVNGPLANLPEFARAFGCKAGDAMVRPERLRAEIW